MATVRIATTEVQVDEMIYTFSTPDRADAFEACVATVDLVHCERDHAPIGMRAADHVSQVSFPYGATPAEDGGIHFNAVVDGKPIPCRISRLALEEHFGARETIRPLDAYAQSQQKIHAIAERKLRKQPQEQVLIDTQDVG